MHMDGQLGNSNLRLTINKFRIGLVVHLIKIDFKNDKRLNLFSAQSDVYPLKVRMWEDDTGQWSILKVFFGHHIAG